MNCVRWLPKRRFQKVTGLSLESKRMARGRVSTSSPAPIARSLPQSSSRLTTAASTAQRRAAPSFCSSISSGANTWNDLPELDPVTGSFAIRHVFSGPDGARPSGRLIQGTDGLIDAITSQRWRGTGSARCSRSTPRAHSPRCTTLPVTMARTRALVSFRDSTAVLTESTGNGGAFNFGTVFVMNVTGGLTTLHDFALGDGT